MSFSEKVDANSRFFLAGKYDRGEVNVISVKSKWADNELCKQLDMFVISSVLQ